ncbi:acylphosphatase [Flavobacteriaceae bacterium Ap0902]|nr:acylphosphatase [Flavobacteriaceae bacterium Ap0902]
MTLNITVKGKVQNVSFRDSSKDKADNLGIRGTVENLENGDVKIIAQGKKAELAQFIEWCKKGPESADVTQVITEEIKDSDFLKNFIVKRW